MKLRRPRRSSSSSASPRSSSSPPEVPAGTSGGAAAIAALAAPFGDVRFVPTGGVGPKNLAEYLAIPAVAAVGGSWMVPRDRVKAGDFTGIQQLTADAGARARASS